MFSPLIVVTLSLMVSAAGAVAVPPFAQRRTNAAALARVTAARAPRRGESAVAFCTPAEPCWPSLADWAALNATVGGHLIQPLRPEGEPCIIDPSSPACADIVAAWTDPTWRAMQPGAMQHPFWESNRTDGSNCYTLGAACAQGDVPPVGVRAASAADVAAALAFAAKYNLRVAVKASGHEIQGRSTAAGALLIWLVDLRDMTVVPDFVACPGDAPMHAVTVGPGVSYGAVYAALDPAYTIVGGSARTVSAAGGHVLSGGHSFVSPHYGLAADNVLSFEAVLANGSVARTSACSHAPLFWALRGGGGGSFAIVTSATYRMHATPPAIAGVEFVVVLLQGLASVEKWLDGMLALAPALTNASANAGAGVFGGYFNVQLISVPPPQQQFIWVANWGYNGSVADANASLAPIGDFAAADPANFYVYNRSVAPYASWEQFHASFDPPATGDRGGSDSTIGCRFVPRSVAADGAQRANASAALTAVAQYVPLLGHLVVGGAVAQFDRDSQHTSLTPAWRDAMWHMCVGIGWASNATVAEQDAAFAGVSQLTQLWRDAIPNSGAYFSEADFLEPDWQGSFFGAENYARLQQVKAAVDPAGRFECWHCVELPHNK